MKVRELKFWLEKMEREGADEVVAFVEGEVPFEKVRLIAKEPNGCVAESIYLTSA